MKTAHEQRFQLQLYTVVTDPEPMETQARMLQAMPGGRKRIFPFTTAQFETILGEIPLLPEHKELLEKFPGMYLHRYSAHSLKKQGTAVLLEAAAKGHIPPEAVAAVDKHKSAATVLPPQTVRYGWRDPNLARINGTAAATRFL